MMQKLSLNDHLQLETEKHPERSYFTMMSASQPQFAPQQLLAEVQSETEHWMALLANATDGKSFLVAFEGAQHVFNALKDEANALKDVERALIAHRQAEWGEASKYYCSAITDLEFGLSDWRSAINDIADDTPFDPYYPTKAERAKHNVEEPPRSSYKEMCEVCPHLLRIYRNMDRVFCIEQELLQRQITCLTNYMQTAEEQEKRFISSQEEQQEKEE